MPIFKNRILGLVLALAVFVLDFMTKTLALEILKNAPIAVIDGFFNLYLAFNRGVSFSFLGGIGHDYLPYILGTFSFVAAFGLSFWLGKESGTRWFKVGLGLIIGGAIGNGIDRFQYGAVVDFLDFYYLDWHYPTFNVADIAIFMGVICVLIDAWIEQKQEK